MQNSKIVKVILPTLCPFCGKESLVCSSLYTPWIDWNLKPETIKEAKETVKNKINKIKFENEEEKKRILDWLDDPETLFGKEEVEQILYQLLNKNTDTNDNTQVAKDK